MTDAAAPAPAGPGSTPLPLWEGRRVEQWARAWGVPRLLVLQRVGSTNDVAMALARDGAAAGTVVIAEEQTAGRGREGRSWSSPAGLGVWMSVVLRPPGAPTPGVLPLLVGLAAARALAPFCRPAEPRIKWPNDVLIGDRKLGGILCEGAWEGDRLAFVVAGIGLNVYHAEADFPPALRATATSVRIAAGWNPPRAELAGAVVARVVEAVRAPVLDAAALAELHRRDALSGREVVVEGGKAAPVRGIASGIARDGALRIATAGGGVVEVRSGTVRLAAAGNATATDDREPALRS